MKGPSKRRKEEGELRQEWTARLNRFAAAKTAKQRQAALEPALKINPGGALRGMLEAWGYSASSRGRKAKSEGAEPQRKPGREQLEAVLEALYGKVPSPVPNLNKKLAGTTPTTVKDACRIVAALVMSWPEATNALGGARTPDASKAKSYAERLIRDLLIDLSEGRSQEWDAEEMEERVFKLIDEERIGVSQFIKEAGESQGALIVAGSQDILIGRDPLDIIQQFYRLTAEFSKGDSGLLIFVFDAALFEAGEGGFRLLYNLGLLTTAMTAFALFDTTTDNAQLITQHRVDWSRWKILNRRCCAVIRKPTLLDPVTGEFLKRETFDEFIANWRPQRNFARLAELKGFVRFDSNHILPRTYPIELSATENLSGHDLYWDITIRHSDVNAKNIEVEYYTPKLPSLPANSVVATFNESPSYAGLPKRAGRPAAKTIPIEEDYLYVVKRESPGALYDDAQRAIYMAARGRLNLDTGARHLENLNAAAALRQNGFEVLPIATLMSMLPRSLHFAASKGDGVRNGG